MFTTEEESNYDRVCSDLYAHLHSVGASSNAPRLGGSLREGIARVPVFAVDCEVRTDRSYQNGRPLDVVGSIIVGQYLLLAGSGVNTGAWLPYRDLKGGAQFAHHIKIYIEDPLARCYSGKAQDLAHSLERLSAVPCKEGMVADVALVVRPVPRVPVLCLFSDADDEFPAAFRFLFDSSAPAYLDLESLAAALHYIYQKIIGEI
jgi:hypothetical protein